MPPSLASILCSATAALIALGPVSARAPGRYSRGRLFHSKAKLPKPTVPSYESGVLARFSGPSRVRRRWIRASNRARPEHQALAGGDCRAASGRRMTNEAMTTSGSPTMLAAAKMVENGSPIISRNGPVPNAATP
jgi:hypothetical protein